MTAPAPRAPERVCRPSWTRLAVVVALLGIAGLLSCPAPTAWLGLAALLLLAGLRWRRQGRPFPASPFSWPMGLYLAGALLGLAVTVRPETAQVRFFGLLAALASFALILDLARTAEAGRRLVLLALLALLAASPLLLLLVAPVLRVDRLPFPLSAVGQTIVALLAPFEPLRDSVLRDESVGQRYRLTTAGLGIFATYGLGLSFGPLLAGPTRSWRWGGGLSALWFGLLLLLPGNRTALLTALLVPLAVLAVNSRWARVALGGLVLVGLLTLLFLAPRGPDSDDEGVFPETATDLGPLRERRDYWHNYLYLTEDFRFSGVGLGVRSVADLYQRRFLPIDPGFNHAHSMILQSYLEQGLFGLAGILSLVGAALAVGVAALRRSRAGPGRLAAVSAAGAGLALLLDGMTEIVPLTTFGMLLLFGALALAGAMARLDSGQPAERSAAPLASGSPPRRLVGAGVVGLGAALVTATLGLGPAGPVEAAGEQAGAAGVPLVSRAAARLYLNLGALSLNQAILEDNPARGERERRLGEAEALLQRALELDAGTLGAYRNLAQAAIARSDPAEARRLLGQARRVASETDSDFSFQLGRLYRETGSVELAVAAWRRTDNNLSAYSCSQPYMQLLTWSAELFAAERFESAARVARAAVQTGPAEPEPYRLLRAALVADGEREAAVRVMEELTQRQPLVPWPYLELAGLYGATDPAAGRLWERRGVEVRRSQSWLSERRRLRQPRDCDQYLPPLLSSLR
jgi:O-antigen ligase